MTENNIRTILIVDDSMVIRNELSNIVKTYGFKVCGEAADGEEAFQKYKELKPDLVLLDIAMPNVCGYEGLKLIKEFDKNADIIMITAYGGLDRIYKCLKLGVRDYVHKPFDENAVIESICKVLNLDILKVMKNKIQ